MSRALFVIAFNEPDKVDRIVSDRMKIIYIYRYNYGLMKNMDKAVARISQAFEQTEKILVFGDYDVDGVTSSVVLNKAGRVADVNYFIKAC